MLGDLDDLDAALGVHGTALAVHVRVHIVPRLAEQVGHHVEPYRLDGEHDGHEGDGPGPEPEYACPPVLLGLGQGVDGDKGRTFDGLPSLLGALGQGRVDRVDQGTRGMSGAVADLGYTRRRAGRP